MYRETEESWNFWCYRNLRGWGRVDLLEEFTELLYKFNRLHLSVLRTLNYPKNGTHGNVDLFTQLEN